MNRKKFFTSVSLGAVGFTIYNSFPMKYFTKKSNNPNSTVRVKMNPLAVSRNPKGNKNV
jgi:hypothetical protein